MLISQKLSCPRRYQWIRVENIKNNAFNGHGTISRFENIGRGTSFENEVKNIIHSYIHCVSDFSKSEIQLYDIRCINIHLSFFLEINRRANRKTSTYSGKTSSSTSQFANIRPRVLWITFFIVRITTLQVANITPEEGEGLEWFISKKPITGKCLGIDRKRW